MFDKIQFVMRQISKVVLLMVSVMFFSSCAFYTIHGVTNNEIGTKKGVAKVTLFAFKADYSYSAAAAAGKIDKIGSWEIKTGFLSIGMTVTGEKAPGMEKEKKSGNK